MKLLQKGGIDCAKIFALLSGQRRMHGANTLPLSMTRPTLTPITWRWFPVCSTTLTFNSQSNLHPSSPVVQYGCNLWPTTHTLGPKKGPFCTLNMLWPQPEKWIKEKVGWFVSVVRGLYSFPGYWKHFGKNHLTVDTCHWPQNRMTPVRMPLKTTKMIAA